MNNIIAIQWLKNHIVYTDSLGNQQFDFMAFVQYAYEDKNIKEQHKCRIKNVVGNSPTILEITSECNLINDCKVYMEFSSAFGSMVFDEIPKTPFITQQRSPKIGDY